MKNFANSDAVGCGFDPRRAHQKPRLYSGVFLFEQVKERDLILGNIEIRAVEAIGENVIVIPRIAPRGNDHADLCAIGDTAVGIAHDAGVMVSFKPRIVRADVSHDLPRVFSPLQDRAHLFHVLYMIDIRQNAMGIYAGGRDIGRIFLVGHAEHIQALGLRIERKVGNVHVALLPRGINYTVMGKTDGEFGLQFGDIQIGKIPTLHAGAPHARLESEQHFTLAVYAHERGHTRAPLPRRALVRPRNDGIERIHFDPRPLRLFGHGNARFVVAVIFRDASEICHEIRILFALQPKFTLDHGGVARVPRVPRARGGFKHDLQVAENPFAVVLLNAFTIPYMVHDQAVVFVGAKPYVHHFAAVGILFLYDCGAIVENFASGNIVAEQNAFEIHLLHLRPRRLFFEHYFDRVVEILHRGAQHVAVGRIGIRLVLVRFPHGGAVERVAGIARCDRSQIAYHHAHVARRGKRGRIRLKAPRYVTAVEHGGMQRIFCLYRFRLLVISAATQRKRRA